MVNTFITHFQFSTGFKADYNKRRAVAIIVAIHPLVLSMAKHLLNHFFDKVYVLTLPRLTERHEKVALAMQGIDFEWFYGVDKADTSIELMVADGTYDDKKDRHNHRYSKTMTIGMLCCAVGHRNIYADMLKKGYDTVLIFEDDVMAPEQPERLRAALETAPLNWDLLYLGYEKNEKPGRWGAVKQGWYHLLRSLGLLKLTHPTISNLFVTNASSTSTSTSTTPSSIRRITRHDMEAGTRVLRIVDTDGALLPSTTTTTTVGGNGESKSTIVLTQDLSHLESKIPIGTPKTPTSEQQQQQQQTQEQEQQHQSVFGLIKVFLQHVSNCTILIKCKLISGTLELHHCDNLTIQIYGPNATVPTVQMDLSNNIVLEFHDAPSGKNPTTAMASSSSEQIVRLYWGEDKDDRIFHAGVQNMTVRLYRDGFLEHETIADYLRDGAKPIGNATAEEMQFVTSVQQKKNTKKMIQKTN
ncbi:MAG: glycosyltransferase family 25 protein, partial [Bacteroidetes bacterium]